MTVSEAIEITFGERTSLGENNVFPYENFAVATLNYKSDATAKFGSPDRGKYPNFSIELLWGLHRAKNQSRLFFPS